MRHFTRILLIAGVVMLHITISCAVMSYASTAHYYDKRQAARVLLGSDVINISNANQVLELRQLKEKIPIADGTRTQEYWPIVADHFISTMNMRVLSLIIITVTTLNCCITWSLVYLVCRHKKAPPTAGA